ncbi:hypothetical protein [Alteraurantiacibacter aquimixticola]|uniref:TonB C-terminal domain-containing protein n=1 Tax=Alteraurantiacibacter aquimixticola TaxID=2489173 RepID=A0A4T3F1I0_9SPHN|nr:hypothetical protein [Alteraurantiacibacter aquimixticola]TIX49222.1 hypothetical protein E5222_16065 [Alteraurantiacibacter aquimixticola]
MKRLIFLAGVPALVPATPLFAQVANAQEEARQLGVEVFWLRRSQTSEDVSGRPLLRRAALLRAQSKIVPEDFPEAIRSNAGSSGMGLTLRVSLAADGRVSGCEPLTQSVQEGFRWREAELVPEVAELVCRLASTKLAFAAALDQEGAGVPSQLDIAVELSSQMRLVVPPPAPAGWGNADAAYEGTWPPVVRSSDISRLNELDLPRGRDLLESNPDRLEEAQVGLVFSTHADGAVGNCQVMQSSGSEEYDRASCEALRSRPQVPGLSHLPVILEWRGRRLRAQLPAATKTPDLAGGVTIGPTLIAGVKLPPNAIVAAELDISSQGELLNCRLSRPSYVDALDRATCALFGEDARFTIPRDAFGNPVDATLEVRVDWRELTISRLVRR